MKCFFRTIAVVILLLSYGVAYADFNDISQIVSRFNHLNGTGSEPLAGAHFTIDINSNYSKTNGGLWQGETRLTFSDNKPDFSAYCDRTSGSNYFQTFCIQTTEYVATGTMYEGILNFEGSQGNAYSITAIAGAQALVNGTATLYRLFATGELANYNYSLGTGRADDAFILQEAIWKLQKQTTSAVGVLQDSDWVNNKYLAALLQSGSKDYWTSVYDPSLDNSGLVVLAMQNVSKTGDPAQDFLYLTKAPSSTPEPAVVGLWVIGFAGLATRRFYSRKKRLNLANC